jgi:branched-subunit amino acid ABC-type transport system permease component
MTGDLAVVVCIQVLSSIATLVLISVGLAVIFGMMRVVNLAHGEFIMLGGYVVVTAAKFGVNLFVSMLVLAPLVVGAIGIIVERVVIRFLYGRMIDTMLATWGLSLTLVGLVTMIFGNTTAGVSAPLGSTTVGRYEVSNYYFFLFTVATCVMFGLWSLLRYTRIGIVARATMQRPDMAAALGVNPRLVYAVTFAVGSALSGLAGALVAPLSGVVPNMGIAYVGRAFITVVSGGSAVVLGTVSASGLLGALDTVVTFVSTPVFGQASLLIGAILLVRVFPQGITGHFFKGAT